MRNVSSEVGSLTSTLGELLKRIPDYEIDESGIERLCSEFFRGFWKLPITFTA